MAVTWSGYKSVGGPVNFRAGIDITYSPAVVTASTTSVTVTTRIYLGASGTAFASGGSWSASGSDSGSGSGVSWSISGSGGSDLFATLTEVKAVTFSSQSFTINATIRPSGSWPGSVSHSRTVTIPAKPMAAPNAPSALTATRVSDSRQNLAWTPNPTADKPYAKQEVWRAADGGSWVMLASLSGGAAASYADTSTTANRRYQYQIRAWNAGGGAYSGVTSPISTTPATPSAPSAAKNAAGDVIVSRPALSPVASTWAVGEFGSATLATGIPASQSTWTHSSPANDKTWRYVVLATSTNPTLNSAWSAPSNVVQLLAPPLAPTALAPSGAADATEPVTFSWAHNPVDTTPQSAYELQWRQQASGGEPENPWTTTGKVASGTPSRTYAAGTWTNPDVIEWQVRTWGNHADAGAWSGTAVLRVSARPSAGIDLPPTHDSSRLTLTWTYFDPEGSAQSAWEMALLDDGGRVVTSRNGQGSASSVLLTGLADAATYTARVRVRDGALLWSEWAETTFTVAYALPPVPTGVAQWHKDDGYVTFTVDVPNPTAGEELADHLQLWRATGNGWVLVADDLAAGEAVVDMTPTAGSVVTYRVAAVSGLPSTSWSSDIVVETRTKWVFFNFGPGFGRVVRIYGNLSVSRSAGRSKVLHQLAGRAYPVERGGDRRTRTYDVSGSLFGPWVADATSTWVDFEDLAFADAPILVRDPEGTRLFCSVGDVDLSDAHATHRRVSVPLTVVDWSEDEVAL